MSEHTDVRQGTLDPLILRTIAPGTEVATRERLSAGVNLVLQRT